MDKELIDKIFRLIKSHSLSKKFQILKYKYNNTKYEFTVCSFFGKKWLKQFEKSSQKIFYYNFEKSYRKFFSKNELQIYVTSLKQVNVGSDCINEENSKPNEDMLNARVQQKRSDKPLQNSNQSTISAENSDFSQNSSDDDDNNEENSKPNENLQDTRLQQLPSDNFVLKNSNQSTISAEKSDSSQISSDDGDSDDVSTILKRRQNSNLLKQESLSQFEPFRTSLKKLLPISTKSTLCRRIGMKRTVPSRTYVTRKRKSVYKCSDSDSDYERNFVSKKRKFRKRSLNSSEGSTCHQCRQKTLFLKTWCEKCRSGKGQFCGKCLLNRYGETISESKQPDWSCPVCRRVCNCSFCMVKKGKRPTGQMISIARSKGFDSVKTFLEEKNV